ncbi:MAG: PAS domain S-box protein [Bacteroidetes bacterium]|nr:PAS domain S-box protein [Bacteroidota bacterium]
MTRDKTKKELIDQLQKLQQEQDTLKVFYYNDNKRHNQADVALISSETQYRRLFETAKDGILILDAETGMIMDVNPFLIELLGYSKPDFMAKAIWEIGFFKDVVANYEKFIELQNSEYVRYEDLPLETAFGEKINVEFVSNVYLVNNRKVIQCNIRDIKERKRAEKKQKLFAIILQILNRQNEWQNIIGDILREIKSFSGIEAVAIRLRDKEEDYPYFCQNGFDEEFIEKENFLCAHNNTGFIPCDQFGIPLLECTCGVVLSGKTDISKPYYTEGGSFWTSQSAELLTLISDEDLRINPRNNCIHSGYNSIALIPIRSGKKVNGLLQLNDKLPDRFNPALIGFYEEIASAIGIAYKRIRTEEALRESEYEFRLLAESMPQIVWINDPDGMNLYYNQQWVDYTGLTLDESNGRGWIKPFHPDDQQRALDAWQNAIKNGATYSLECRLCRADGIYRWWLIRGVPILDEQGSIHKWFGTCTDIDDIKLNEEILIIAKENAEESDRLKSAFLANMSHEIRTPLNGILGFSELLKESELSGNEQKKYLDIIEKSGERMLNTINDLIDISRIESGLIGVYISEININKQNEHLFSFFKPAVAKKGLTMSFENTLTYKDSVIKTDKEKVYAILSNLIKNAIRFTDKGTIVYGYKKFESYFEFFVKDTGIGINKEKQKIIFNRFRQVEEGFSRGYEGSGLGLSISKAYVEMLGGKIWVKSIPGKGSIFYFTIPFDTIQQEKELIHHVRSIDQIENHVVNLKMLIVDDDEASQILISMGLHSFYKEVLMARTGIEAIEICRKNPDIDLILMDIRMPEMDGYEATRQIRQFNTEVIIIAQTAFALSGDREKAMEAGCDDYISKPIDNKLLRLMVNKHFSNQIV